MSPPDNKGLPEEALVWISGKATRRPGVGAPSGYQSPSEMWGAAFSIRAMIASAAVLETRRGMIVS